MMLAGVHALSQAIPAGELKAGKRQAREWTPIRILRLGTPVLWVGLVFVLIRVTPFQPNFWNRPELPAWVGSIIGLIILRQMIELGENQRLHRELRALETSLEERIAERTAGLRAENQALRHAMEERAHIEQILREREELMEHTAMHDALTGLPNRLLLMEHLRQAIRKLERWDRYSVALLFIDFDGFKTVNDRLGHLFGDKLLVAVGQRLRRYVREIDTVARLGGDEFVVLLEDVMVERGACPAVERIHEILCEPYEIDEQRIVLSASIGVVVGDRTYLQPADFLRDADLAMYEAKARGKDGYVIFSPELRSHALDRLVLEDDLRAALARDELVVYYHPILCLATHRVTGFEALVRWRHPRRGLITPDAFIPIAETSHLIFPLTRKVLLLACGQVRQWQSANPADRELTISVNLSPTLFAQPGAQELVEEALAESGLPARFLNLEITEGAMVKDSQGFQEVLHAWRRRGIQIHMDDFGTGYASLSYLHRFPMDALKIDRSFIQRIQPNGGQGEIPRTVITLARELNMQVIAEGVETATQLAFLERLGCQYAQGYLISRPLPTEDVQDFLRGFQGPQRNWLAAMPVLSAGRSAD
jgi:diguanylate cyclase (GGDEF)-like protein